MSTEDKRGEQVRPGKTPGRNKLPEGEKKERIEVFVKGSIVEAMGGKDQVISDIYYFLGQK